MHRAIYDSLVLYCWPSGPIEEIWVDRLAFTYLRMLRLARAEGAFHLLTWELPKPEVGGGQVTEQPAGAGGDGRRFNPAIFEEAVRVISRLDRALSSQLVQLLHEPERAQRMRNGERIVPASMATLNIHTDGP